MKTSVCRVILWAVYRVPSCPGGKAKPGHPCRARNGLEYLASHLSRRFVAAIIAGIETRRHYELVRIGDALTMEQHNHVVNEIARTGDKSGRTTLRCYGQLIRGELPP
jgi:acyl dehydratase